MGRESLVRAGFRCRQHLFRLRIRLGDLARQSVCGRFVLNRGWDSGREHRKTVWGGDLYAGGAFTTAGGKVSAYIARAYITRAYPLPHPALSVLRSGADIIISWPSPNTPDFALEQASTMAAPVDWVPNSAAIADDGTNKSVSIPAANGAQFFRLRRP